MGLKLSEKTKYRICLHKNFLEQGIALTTYVKWLIAFFGVASRDVYITLLLGFVYLPVGYLVGRFWYMKGWQEQNAEVQNQFNYFMKEVRKKLR